MAKLRIPTPLRPYAQGINEIEVQSSTVSGALEELTEKYPALQTHLFDDAGELRAFVNLFLNEEDVRYMQGVETQLKEGDRLMIVPSVAGG